MAKFLECTAPYIIYRRGEKVYNHAVNLDLCRKLIKSSYAWYPDNVGKPSIKFDGCDTEWVFDKDTDRDGEHARIMHLFGHS